MLNSRGIRTPPDTPHGKLLLMSRMSRETGGVPSTIETPENKSNLTTDELKVIVNGRYVVEETAQRSRIFELYVRSGGDDDDSSVDASACSRQNIDIYAYSENEEDCDVP